MPTTDRTHHVGDDCPGGHRDNPHLTADQHERILQHVQGYHDDPLRDLLIGYSEWLDADEGLVIVTEDDERTHGQLVEDYLEYLRDL